MKNLTLKYMKKIFKSLPPAEDKLIGFIGTMPVYSNPMVPDGVMYALNDNFFKIKPFSMKCNHKRRHTTPRYTCCSCLKARKKQRPPEYIVWLCDDCYLEKV